MTRNERKAESKRLRDAGWSVPQIAAELKCGTATVYRDLLPEYAARNREACRRRRHGPLPLPPEKLCRVCFTRFQPARVDQYLCDSPLCKRAWGNFFKFWYVELTAEQVREHIALYGEVTEEICGYIGLTVGEVEWILNQS